MIGARVLMTLLALAFAAYVRLQPPTVIRVDENGLATVLGEHARSRSGCGG